MSPTPLTAAAVAAVGGLALVLPATLVLALLAALAVAIVVDARLTSTVPEVRRSGPTMLARGVPAPLELDLAKEGSGTVRIRQAASPDISVAPAEADDALHAVVVAGRRGRHTLPAPALRVRSPLGLVARYRAAGEPMELRVYPDLPAARRIATSVRQGKFSESGRLRRGPLGLGTDFEAIREYLPDDDIRQVNWPATVRMGRPMSNQFRMEQDREVTCVIDVGRLMAAPIGDRTRVDAAVDAAVAVAMVADELGDHSGLVAFDDAVRRRLAPRRRAAETIIEAVFDLEPSARESDYELAFRTIAARKRGLVIVFTDLLDEAAAASLLEAMPYLTRRQVVVVASASDVDLANLLETTPVTSDDVHRMSIAAEVLAARHGVARRLRAAGAEIVESTPDRLAGTCVAAYLKAKRHARL